MKSFKSLIGHSLNYGLGDVLPQLLGFLLIPLYTRYLTPTDYGILEIVSTLTIFLIPLMKMGIPGAVTRYYYEYKDNHEHLKDFITTMNTLLNRGAIILASLVFLILYFFGKHLFVGIDFWPFMVLAIISSAVGANNQLQKKLIQNRLQSRLNLILQLVFAISNILLALLLIVVFKLGALGSILASTIVAIGFYVQALFYLKNDITGKYRPEMAKEALTYGTGILPHHMAINTSPLITKAMLANVGSLALLGVFSISMRFITPLLLICTSLNTVMVPLYNESRKNKDDDRILELIRQVLIVSIISYIGFVFLMPSVMRWVLPPTYLSSIVYIPILAIGFLGRTIYHVAVAEIFYQKKTRFISIITIIGLLFNVGIAAFMVKDYGAIALCWAYSVTYLIWGSIALLYRGKISGYQSFKKELGLFVLIGSVVALASFLMV